MFVECPSCCGATSASSAICAACCGAMDRRPCARVRDVRRPDRRLPSRGRPLASMQGTGRGITQARVTR